MPSAARERGRVPHAFRGQKAWGSLLFLPVKSVIRFGRPKEATTETATLASAKVIANRTTSLEFSGARSTSAGIHCWAQVYSPDSVAGCPAFALLAKGWKFTTKPMSFLDRLCWAG